VIPEIDEDADRRLSKRVLVKKRFEPSVRLVVDMFSEEVANPMKVLFGPPISRDDEAIDVKPVPPYTTPIDVVAVTNPLFACRGPFRVPRVNVELKALALVNVFELYVLGIVEEPLMYELTRVSL
jgi:hypothetical protein